MARRRGLLAELQRQAAINAREQQRADAAFVRAQAAAAREAERARRAAERAREQAARADAKAAAEAEKVRKQAYLEARQAEVSALNAELDSRIAGFDDLLVEALSRDSGFDIASTRRRVEHPPFEPGDLGRATPQPRAEPMPPEPRWVDVAPAEPTGLSKTFGGRARHERAVADARARFESDHARWRAGVEAATQRFRLAQEEHRHAEHVRRERLTRAREEHDREGARREDEVQRHNREVEQFADSFARRDPDAVVGYFDMVLSMSPYPDDVPQHHRVAYVPESSQLVVEQELPAVDVVPVVREHRYVKARDEITTVARPAKEIRSRYSALVARIVLRTLYEIVNADRARLIETVVLNGVVHTTDPATGRSVSPCLISLRTTRDVVNAVDFARIDPLACLAHLGAGISSKPDELAPVRPVVEFDMADKRYIEETDVLSDLDRRPNLLELKPSEFESLIQNLFARMGLDTKQTRASRDGGVDCVAINHDTVLGGKVVIQAKRYRHTVDVSAVRDLYGTVQNEGASKGILVTTSGYGPASHEFVKNKPLELISGSNLLYLLAEHAGIEARIVVPDESASSETSPPLVSPSTTLVAGRDVALDGISTIDLSLMASGQDTSDVDPVAFLLAGDGEVSRDEDMVFYGQPRHPSGAVRTLTTAVGLHVDLAVIPRTVDEVLIVASGPPGHSNGSILDVRSEPGGSLARFDLPAAGPDGILQIGALGRTDTGWSMHLAPSPRPEDLATLARAAGVDVT